MRRRGHISRVVLMDAACRGRHAAFDPGLVEKGVSPLHLFAIK